MIQLKQSILIGYSFREEDFSHLYKKVQDAEYETAGNTILQCVVPEKWVVICKDRAHDVTGFDLGKKIAEDLDCVTHDSGSIISYGLRLEESDHNPTWGEYEIYDTFYQLDGLFEKLTVLKAGLQQFGLTPQEPVLVNCLDFGKRWK